MTIVFKILSAIGLLIVLSFRPIMKSLRWLLGLLGKPMGDVVYWLIFVALVLALILSVYEIGKYYYYKIRSTNRRGGEK